MKIIDKKQFLENYLNNGTNGYESPGQAVDGLP